MHVELKTNGYPLSEMDQDKLAESIAHIDRLTDTFPSRRIHVSIEKFGHSEDCQVRILFSTLKHRLVVMDRARAVAPAMQRCVDLLSEQIQLSKERVHKNHGERAIRRAKEEAALFDWERVKDAHRQGDYEAYKDALGEVPDMLGAEIGRRIKFHPTAEALLGERFHFDDIIEAVIWHSFEYFEAKPANVPFRDFVLQAIDYCIVEVAKEAMRADEEGLDVRPSDMAA